MMRAAGTGHAGRPEYVFRRYLPAWMALSMSAWLKEPFWM